jgi:hypothetical protein
MLYEPPTPAIRQTSGRSSMSDLPLYFDTVSTGDENSFNGGNHELVQQSNS